MTEFRQSLHLRTADVYVRANHEDMDDEIALEIEMGHGDIAACISILLSSAEADQVCNALQLAIADCSLRGGA